MRTALKTWSIVLLLLVAGCGVDVGGSPVKPLDTEKVQGEISKAAFAAAQNRDRIAAELGLKLADEIEASDSVEQYDGALMRRLAEINDTASREAFSEVTAMIAKDLNPGKKLDKKKVVSVIREFYQGRQRASLPLPE